MDADSMTYITECQQRAKEIHHRLMSPPNAVLDAGINLRPKNTSPPPPKKLLESHPEIAVKVTVTEIINDDKPIHLKIKDILHAVSDSYGVTIPQIMGERRSQLHVRPRHVAFYIASRYTGLSLAGIGRYFGRDHTTILHAIKCMEERLLVDKGLSRSIAELESMLLMRAHAKRQDNDRSTLAAKPEQNMAEPWQKGLSGC